MKQCNYRCTLLLLQILVEANMGPLLHLQVVAHICHLLFWEHHMIVLGIHLPPHKSKVYLCQCIHCRLGYLHMKKL